MGMTKSYDENDWLQLVDPLPNDSTSLDFMEHITTALEHEHHIPYLEQSLGSNMSIVEWVLSQTPVVHEYAARVMFDALDVDERNDPIIVASRISEIMSGENIFMLDISEDPPWYPQQRIGAVEPGARSKEYAIRKMVSPTNAKSSEAESEEIKARISSRNAAFANELSKREIDAQRLSTPDKFATEPHALGLSTKDDARDVFECERENTVSRALIANKDARIELLQEELSSQRTQFKLQVAGSKFEKTLVQQQLLAVLNFGNNSDELSSVQQRLLAILNNTSTTGNGSLSGAPMGWPTSYINGGMVSDSTIDIDTPEGRRGAIELSREAQLPFAI